jgi:hypothetical protein
MAKVATALEDKRSSQRRRILKQGRISFNGRRSTIDCTVRDFSETGALLKVTSSVGVPDQFELVLVTENRVIPCVVVRRGAKEVGVVFEDDH